MMLKIVILIYLLIYSIYINVDGIWSIGVKLLNIVILRLAFKSQKEAGESNHFADEWNY